MSKNQTNKIGLFTATLVGINAMIGAGIFSAPAILASNVGPAGLLTYLIVILGVLCMALSFANLAEQFPEEGAFYTYAKQWGGHTAGLISITAYLVGILIAMGLLTQFAGIYVYSFLDSVGFFSTWNITTTPYIVGVIILLLLVLLNMVGGVAANVMQVVAISCTSIPLAAITLMCFTKADLNNLVPFAPYGFGNVMRAMQAVIFGFLGFESTIALYGIVENPKKNVPRALLYAISFVSTIYFLFIASIFLAIPASYFTSPTIPLSQPLEMLFPDQHWLISIIHIAITISFLSVINAVIWSTSSLFISITHKFKSAQGKRFRTYVTPRTSVLLMGLVIGTAYSSVNNIQLFFAYTNIFIMVAYITALLALYKVRSKLSGARQVQAALGILTACIIFGFAIERLCSLII